jgi:DNA repair exonuclease SbcCD ATPase subunit/DNA repair exonuclease SbcCD nuclease subunit
MYKIAHIADTHIRNLKFHDEYKAVFKKLYIDLKRKQPDLIIHCGDIAHTKTQLSPEYFALASSFLKSLADIAPTYIVLGNHDGNLKNANRQDAITPIVEALGHPDLHLKKHSGEFEPLEGIVFNVLSVFDRENWVQPSDKEKINVALYHGAITGCTTDTGWKMTHGEDTIEIFNNFDFAMLGDIHARQALDLKGRIRYAGSTVQQNFGESKEKGYLLWNINHRWDWSVDHNAITNPRPFETIRLNRDGSVPNQNITKGCRLRLVSTSNLPIDKIRKATDIARTRYSPYSVSFLNKGTDILTESKQQISGMENLRNLKVQEKWIREYLKDYELDDESMKEILDMNSRYNREAESDEEISRNIVWKIKKMEFSNLFNYGTKNTVNFEKLQGLVGVFGKNYSGKSSIIDSALFGLYNTTSKEERKNVHLINQNKESASIKMVISSGEQDYRITRNLNKYAKKLRGKETFEAKTDLDFHNLTLDESLNGDTRNETDKNIRKIFGTIEDFMITSMASQLDSLSFIREGSTKRKEILAKFLDLDLFDQKFKLAKKESADTAVLIKRYKQKKLSEIIKIEKEKLSEIEDDIYLQKKKCDGFEKRRTRIAEEMASLEGDISSLPTEIIDIRKVRINIERKMSKKSKILEQIAEWEGQIKSFETPIRDAKKYLEENPSEASLDNLIGIYRESERGVKTRSTEINSFTTRQKALKKKIKMLDNHKYDPDCEYCTDNKFVKDAKKASELLPPVEEQIEFLEAAILGFKESMAGVDIESVLRTKEQRKNNKETINRLEREIEMIGLFIEGSKPKVILLESEVEVLIEEEKEYEDNRETIENLSTLMREKSAMEKVLLDLAQKCQACNDITQGLLIEKGSALTSVERCEQEQKEFEALEKEWKTSELYMRCMHPNGIAYEIIKQRLPLINEETAKVLANIVDFEILFENNDKKLEIFIKHPKYEPRPLSMGSGAEKTIAAMAIRLALISITNLPKSELFILDEPATALDQEHMEGFTRLLDMIKTKFKTVLLISHLDVLKDCVDTTIDIERKGGYAKVSIK